MPPGIVTFVPSRMLGLRLLHELWLMLYSLSQLCGFGSPVFVLQTLRLVSGDTIPFDFLVLQTGSNYNLFKPNAASIDGVSRVIVDVSLLTLAMSYLMHIAALPCRGRRRLWHRLHESRRPSTFSLPEVSMLSLQQQGLCGSLTLPACRWLCWLRDRR